MEIKKIFEPIKLMVEEMIINDETKRANRRQRQWTDDQDIEIYYDEKEEE